MALPPQRSLVAKWPPCCLFGNRKVNASWERRYPLHCPRCDIWVSKEAGPSCRQGPFLKEGDHKVNSHLCVGHGPLAFVESLAGVTKRDWVRTEHISAECGPQGRPWQPPQGAQCPGNSEGHWRSSQGHTWPARASSIGRGDQQTCHFVHWAVVNGCQG